MHIGGGYFELEKFFKDHLVSSNPRTVDKENNQATLNDESHVLLLTRELI